MPVGRGPEPRQAHGLAPLLRSWRVRAGLSREQLAERAGLSPQAISALEQGARRRPYPHTLAALADALELAPADRTALLQAAAPASAEVGSPDPLPRLQIPSTPLIGREAELAAVCGLLQPGAGRARLLTLLGPGGVGKTQLALTVAAALGPSFRDGSVFVDLAAVREPELVPASIAHSLELRESADRSARDLLIDRLREAQLLLVLDNLEHLTGARALLVELLEACPCLALLVTSRTVLRLGAEHRFAVEPLAAPEAEAEAASNVQAIADSPAVRLFVERAQVVRPEFALTAGNAAAVAAVCRRVEGIPLAIELAAARVALLTPDALLERLDQQLAVLTGGAGDRPARQRTLRNTLAWSHDLLSPAERVLFRRLAVFDRSWSLAAAEAVCAGDSLSPEGVLDLLGALVDNSLVRRDPDEGGQVRFRMLEAVREYGRERLAGSREEAVVDQRHAAYYVSLAETAEPQLTGLGHAQWMARLKGEHDNLRCVLRWALATGEIESGLRLASAIWHFWWVRGYLREGHQWLAELLRSADGVSSVEVRAKALNAAGGLALGLGDYDGARALYEESLAAGRAIQDSERVGTALHNLAYLASERGDTARAAALIGEHLAAERGQDDRLLGPALATAGEIALQQSDRGRAAELLDEALVVLRRRGNSLWEGGVLLQQGHVARESGDWAVAKVCYREALHVYGQLGEHYTLGVARCLEGLAGVDTAEGQAPRAARLLGAASALRDTISAPLAPSARTAYERLEAMTRAAVGEDCFRAAWQAGRMLSLAEAVDVAMDARQAPPADTADTAETTETTGVAPAPLPSKSIGPPLIRPRLLPRQRLSDRLDMTLAHAATLVAAPAGFGKTSALVEWEAHARDRALVAWVSLAPADNDPARFWRCILSALQVQHPTLGARALVHLQAQASIGLLLDELVCDIAALDRHLVLVLDDYHAIQTPGIHTALAELLSRCPAHFHLLISTRSDPPLPLARLRANGQLVEVRAADLRFSASEAAGLLGTVMGIELSGQDVATLSARTEGWAAGLQLAALMLRERTDLSDAIARFAGSDRFIIDYFVEEVLARLPDRTRAFLERTSLLDRLSGSLCDAVVGEPGSAAMLEELERANVFVTPANSQRTWYRYHQLFAGALRHRLQRDEPQLVLELHERASTWYAANGLPEEAVEHALISQRWDPAADLIGQLIGPLLRRGEHMTLQRWLAQVPEGVCQRHPALSGHRASTLLVAGEFPALDAFFYGAEPALEAAGEHHALGQVLCLHAELAAIREDTGLALACAERGLRLLSPGPSVYRVAALNGVARIHLLQGDLAAAAGALHQARDAITDSVARLAVWETDSLAAYLSLLEGQLHRAATRYGELLRRVGERSVLVRDVALLQLSGLAYEWNRLEEAANHLDRVAEERQRGGRTFELPFPALLRARLARARGQFDPANDALDRAEEAARKVSSNRLWRVARAERAGLALAQGRLSTAVRWAEEVTADPDGLESFAREPEVLMLARVRRAQGAGASVVPLLERLLASAEQSDRGASVVAILVQLALSYEQGGDERRGSESMQRAVTLAEPSGYVRLFVDEGQDLLPLLRDLLRRGVCPSYLDCVLHALRTAGDASARPSELVTPREGDVLGLLALGLSNRAIAEQLVTSEATVKSHIHRLIGKLGVASRAQVVVRAREIGLRSS